MIFVDFTLFEHSTTNCLSTGNLIKILFCRCNNHLCILKWLYHCTIQQTCSQKCIVSCCFLAVPAFIILEKEKIIDTVWITWIFWRPFRYKMQIADLIELFRQPFLCPKCTNPGGKWSTQFGKVTITLLAKKSSSHAWCYLVDLACSHASCCFFLIGFLFISFTICDQICQNPPHTHTMAKNIFHYQSIALSIS